MARAGPQEEPWRPGSRSAILTVRGRSPVRKAGQVCDFYRAGVSKAEIARRLQIGRTSVRRILQERM